MGMSASQARLLQLTARMTDVTNRGQNLQNVKIQLAASQDTLAADYAAELEELSTMIQDAKTRSDQDAWKALNGQMLLAMGVTVIWDGKLLTDPSEHPEPQRDEYHSNLDAFRSTYPTQSAYEEAMVPSSNYQVTTVPGGTDEEGNPIADTYSFGGKSYSNKTEAESAAYMARQEALKAYPSYTEAREEAVAKDQQEYDTAYNTWRSNYGESTEAYNMIKNASAQDLAAMMTSGKLEIFKDNNGDGVFNDGDDSVSDYTSRDVLNAAYEAEEAKATAEYEAEMKKLSNKEKKIDMEIKQLDTEYNALKTEHDSLKAVIKDNTEKTFGTFSG